MKHKIGKRELDRLYKKYNKREYIHPDPLEFLYNYEKTEDREIVGLIASSLAYGNVKQILKSVSTVLAPMGKSPYRWLTTTSNKKITETYEKFKHRFTTGKELAVLLIAIKKIIEKDGFLKNCFLKGFKTNDENLISALTFFVEELRTTAGSPLSHLIPSPEKGSACKRLNLFLRWMVRHDEVDPGGWNNIPASKLTIPLDTHMYNIGFRLGFTKRKQANLKTAIEISEAFKRIAPDDPTRYDFTLTRFGIRNDMKILDIFQQPLPEKISIF